MSPETKQRLELAVAGLAVALLSSLTTQLGNCQAGIATKGDLAQLATKADLAAITGKAKRGQEPTLADRVDAVEAHDQVQDTAAGARDLRFAIVLREQTAAIVASWRVQSTGQQRRAWSEAHGGARARWNDYPGTPVDEVMERVLLNAGVPR